MTLVITEITGLGVVIVGDSAVTVQTSTGPRVYTGAAKVQYSSRANIGFALWGRACVDGRPADSWLAEFIDSCITDGDSLEVVAARLAVELNTALRREKRDWNELRRGIHIAGYVGDLPHLYHIHTGNPEFPQHELRVFKDFPYDNVPNLDEYRRRLATLGGYHLRNGFYEVFGPLFDAIYGYTEVLRQLDFSWPNKSLEHRVSLYRLLVKFISDTLVADDRPPSVGGEIQALGFTARGLTIDQITSPTPGSFPCGTNAEFGQNLVAA
jgi:hypothetical protein